MGTKIQQRMSSHIDEDLLMHLAKGELDRESHPDVYEHLLEPCENCEDFLAKEGILEEANGYDLDEEEAELILHSILGEIEPIRLSYAQQASLQKVPQKSWFQKVLDWHFATWMLPVAAMTILLVWFGKQEVSTDKWMPPISRQRPIKQVVTKKTKPVEHPTTKLAYGKRAFLHIRVERETQRSKNVQKITFHHKAKLFVGDAMLFRFRVMKTGHLYLLRQGANGELEQLYPFSKKSHPVFKAGVSVELTMNGQRVAYFLEPKHQGKQRLLLIQSEGRQHFPEKISLLSEEQKRLFAESDFMDFEVLKRKDRFNK